MRSRKNKNLQRKRGALLSRSRKLRQKSQVFSEVDDRIIREIWAILYLAFAMLLALSISENLGFVGGIINGFMMPIFGWGIYLLPIVFSIIGILMLFYPQLKLNFLKIVGITVMFICLLGLMHLQVPPDEIHKFAQEGKYGGYIGFVISFLVSAVLGESGAYVFIITLLIVSILVTFEFSLLALLSFLKPEFKFVRKLKEKQEEAESNQKSNFDFIPEINVIKPELQEVKKEKEEKKEVMEEPKNEVIPVEKEDLNIVRLLNEEKKKNEEADKVKKEEKAKTYIEWQPPDLGLLSSSDYSVTTDDKDLKKKAQKIRQKLQQFGIAVTMHDVHVGPTVLQYTLKPHEGVKLSRITSLKSDLALTLSAKAIRIEAPIPGKPFVGIEVPNDQRQIVHVRGLMESSIYETVKSRLKLPIGRDVSGMPIVDDLSKMPHLLVAGATGSGKSVCMNTFLISLLYNNSPADLRLILIDPKRVELSIYNGIPHLLTPVINNPEKAAIALRWAVSEMNRRYIELSEKGFRNLDDFNGNVPEEDKLPKIVIVIDELADLMIAASKDVEAAICRIAQMARAVGIHLIVATQRPSVDVITGLIKANIPARIAFTVTAAVDSRTIIDCIGAEDLLGEGDMLYLPGNMGKPIRVQGVFVSTKEIQRVTRDIKLTVEPDYDETITSDEIASQKIQGLPMIKTAKADDASDENEAGDGKEDSLYEAALKLIVDNRKASASFLQRRLRVGYARAARLLDELEENGVIGPSQGAKAREIFISRDDINSTPVA